MKKNTSSPSASLDRQWIETVIRRLGQNQRVRRDLPAEGRINIDRQLPFLVVYRKPHDHWDGGTDRFVLGEASYVIMGSDPPLQKSLHRLIHRLASEMSRIFGAFLILEIWSSRDGLHFGKKPAIPKPAFKIHVPKRESYPPHLETMESALKTVGISRQRAAVIRCEGNEYPAEMKPLLSPGEARKLNCHFLGLEIKPIYRDSHARKQYPLWRQSLHRQLSKALQKTFYSFIRSQTKMRPPSFQSLGKRAMVKAVYEIDKRMAEISDSFDLLLYLNPLNAQGARRAFRRSRYEKTPYLIYPPLAIFPAHLKRKLYSIPLTRVEDPAIAEILQEKRMELDIQLTLLLERGTKKFLPGSLQIYGTVEKELYDKAKEILHHFPARTREGKGQGFVNGETFASFAWQSIRRYRRDLKEFSGTYEIHDGISSLMVSQGRLLIGRNMEIPKPRIQALIHHEVGTHMVTYYNALTQPLRLLHAGLAGYDQLQEGLGVLAEFLSGGLTHGRLRLLAARVVAARRITEGADFVQVFQELVRKFNFSKDVAFTITLRVFRGGGLTKDAMYLRGLLALFHYLKEGGSMEPLFVGKIALQHLGIIKELLMRKILHKPPLTPYYLHDPQATRLLGKIRSGLSFFELIRREH